MCLIDQDSYFRHPTSDIKTTFIGKGTKIWQNSVILSGARIGKECNINAHTLIENGVIIGDRVTIKSGVYLWNGCSIGDDVFIGPCATFVNDIFPRSKKTPALCLLTRIEQGSSIGANATIIGGVRIGKGAFVGAGSVVLRDVPDFEVWAGNPARLLRRL